MWLKDAYKYYSGNEDRMYIGDIFMKWPMKYGRRWGGQIRKRMTGRTGFSIDPLAKGGPNLTSGRGSTGIEYKFADEQFASTYVSETWTGGEMDPAVINCLCMPSRGTGASDRSGDHIVIKNIQVRGAIKFAPLSGLTDSTTSVEVAVLLVLDTQTNGAQLNAEDVMIDTSPKTLSYRNLKYTSRFKILKKERCTLHQTCGFNTSGPTGNCSGNGKIFNWNIPVNIKVDFSGDTGTIADITSCSLHVIACTQYANVVKLSYFSRVRFVG